ncbi:hypothetical protein XENTR_v10013822 [Xenopus tropicalis]|uniref:Chromosome 6 open reading frame 118 n=2 Tax=Xenopus tropicalis TaxID=8364 RepID=F6QEB3_XENTR|nr:hypothetical protein XENTR_v10013822 [Xenopus tropicalis]KAE8601883.1 hypothetical protein XENTR_v10013822 [Xenopus tropicalis]KAE8601884.1 hypothetical protein XENTR_v10013822 [Xenopus tropicalis]
MKPKQQENISLPKLLDAVEKANKNETYDYTSGHLNHNHLFQPQKTERTFWRSVKELKQSLPGQKQFSPNEFDINVKKVKDKLATISMETSLLSNSAKTKSSNVSAGPYTPINTPFMCSKSEVNGQENHESKGHKNEFLIKEPDFPELKIWNFGAKETSQKYDKDYHVQPSYLAELTRTDQFNVLLQFNKYVIGKDDMTKDFFKNVLVEHFERKLKKKLLKIGHVTPPHLARLNVFSEIFEDICKNSSIFGNILRQIKIAYELNIENLLDVQSATQSEILMAEISGMKKRAVQTQDIEDALQTVRRLEQEAHIALERNEQLRNNLKAELTRSSIQDTAKEILHTQVKESNTKPNVPSISDTFESKRCEVLAISAEIQGLEQEMKKNMTHAVNTELLQRHIKDIQAEAVKIKSSNEFLQSASKGLGSEMKRLLAKQKLTVRNQGEIKNLIECYFSSEDQSTAD